MLVASGGGHWMQLLRMKSAWEEHEQVFVTTIKGYNVEGERVHVVTDASRWNKFKLVKLTIQLLRIFLIERPDVVISTGAAAGYLAVRIGKWMGAKTIWVDSIANVESLSLSAKRAGRIVDLWLTQWPHLADPDGPQYEGAIL